MWLILLVPTIALVAGGILTILILAAEPPTLSKIILHITAGLTAIAVGIFAFGYLIGHLT